MDIHDGAGFLLWFFNKLSLSRLEEFLVMCWGRWNERNRDVLARKEGVHLVDVDDEEAFGWEFCQQYLKDFHDVAVNLVRSRSDFGAVARTTVGEVLYVVSQPVEWVVNAEIMESIAIRESVAFVLDMGLEYVEVESDAQRIVRMFNSKSSYRSEVGQIIEETILLATRLKAVRFVWCRRQANRLAHSLAKMAAIGESAKF